MQYGNIQGHSHSHSHAQFHGHSCPPSNQQSIPNGSTILTVPVYSAPQEPESNCCKDLEIELNQLKARLKAMPDLTQLGAGLLNSNGATPAAINPLSFEELAKQLAPLLKNAFEKDTYQFFDAFGKEIIPQIYANRSQSPRG